MTFSTKPKDRAIINYIFLWRKYPKGKSYFICRLILVKAFFILSNQQSNCFCTAPAYIPITTILGSKCVWKHHILKTSPQQVYVLFCYNSDIFDPSGEIIFTLKQLTQQLAQQKILLTKMNWDWNSSMHEAPTSWWPWLLTGRVLRMKFFLQWSFSLFSC